MPTKYKVLIAHNSSCTAAYTVEADTEDEARDLALREAQKKRPQLHLMDVSHVEFLSDS